MGSNFVRTDLDTKSLNMIQDNSIEKQLHQPNTQIQNNIKSEKPVGSKNLIFKKI